MKIIPVEPFDLVVFGATGDLSRRKILPGLYQRDRAGQLPDAVRLIAVARTDLETDAFRAEAAAALAQFVPQAEHDSTVVARFLGRLSYLRVDAVGDDGWQALGRLLNTHRDRIRAFYLAVAPAFFGPICTRLAAHDLVTPRARLVVEKPFGTDLATASALNDQIGQVFQEARTYRIDHYLGKETVQNLMALRFGNAMFEPLWNSHHIDHVQITVAESLGVEGRGSYYDAAGAMRDMVQNHVLQLLCLIAMEPPVTFTADAVRDEKLKVLRALAPITGSEVERCTVRGQYRRREAIAGYTEDVGVGESDTESFVAIRVAMRNWRWAGVPFYLRTGKRLRARMSEIALVFKPSPPAIFGDSAGTLRPNVLTFRLQPDESVSQTIMIKDPGPGGMRLREATLDMSFQSDLGLGQDWRMPDAYERLILDVVRGNQTLFMRRDEVEAAWAWVDPIIQEWERQGIAPAPYDPGSSGPEEALRLIHQEGRRWREIR